MKIWKIRVVLKCDKSNDTFEQKSKKNTTKIQNIVLKKTLKKNIGC